MANLVHGRVVTTREVVEALSRKERGTLDQAYSGSVNTALSRVLRHLRRKDLVFSPGKIGRRRYYGSIDELDPATAELPDQKSRRRRVLDFVLTVTTELDRAVRHADVVDAAQRRRELSDLAPELIGRDLLNLSRTGDLQVVGKVRGDGRGRNLYLPAELDPEEYAVDEPLTWLEEVAAVFEALWEKEATAAANEDRRMRPLSTGLVRSRLAREKPGLDQLEDPQLVVNAMRQLSKSDQPVVQAIRRPNEKALLWAPVDVDPDALDVGNAYATDTERVAKAATRAEESLGRPATVQDVRDEIAMDPTLRPAGTQDLHVILSDLSKETVDHGGVRRPRQHQRIERVGRVDGTTYYSARADERALAFVRIQQLETTWLEIDAAVRAREVAHCMVPTIGAGRVKLLRREVTEFREEASDVDTTGDLASADRQLLGRLAEAAEDMSRRLDWMLADLGDVAGDLPSVRENTPGLTPCELKDLLEPLYPRAAEVDDPTKLVPLLEEAIRRIPNPGHESRWSEDHDRACEFLFDRTDALLEAAKRWGGHQCRLHAMMAQEELGRLRDPRFILPALNESDYQRRLRAVSCLAFVPSEEGIKRLKEVAAEDRDRGVRESAAWAHGFAGGLGASELTDSAECYHTVMATGEWTNCWMM